METAARMRRFRGTHNEDTGSASDVKSDLFQSLDQIISVIRFLVFSVASALNLYRMFNSKVSLFCKR